MLPNLRLFCIAASLLLAATTVRDLAGADATLPPPTPPDKAIKQFTLPDDLQISLVAAEPAVTQPLSITFDDRGRMWVIQYRQYPNPSGLKAVQVDQYLRTKYDQVPPPPPRGPRGADHITIYSDFDAQGRPTKSKDFLSGLNLCSGCELGYDGLFVLQPPYLLFYPDRNHDDVPDGSPEVLLTGFGLEDSHSLANSLTWGPDGWLYGAQGSTVTAHIRGIEFQQGIWRYRPRTCQFELFAEGGGNTWGIDFDRFGNLFAGGNTVQPLLYHMQGAYYLKGFGKHGPLHNPHAYGYFPALNHVGYLGNGLTGGFVIYRGGALPSRWNDMAIYPNLRQSAVRYATIVPLGSTFETHYGGDFIVTPDVGFCPVDGYVGPDGAIYFADWYDTHIAYADPKDRTKVYQPRIDDGRIWKVTAHGAATKISLDTPLRQRTDNELLQLLTHPNEWYVRQARLILAERKAKSVLPRLQQLALGGEEELALEALWTYYTIAGLDDSLAAKLLDQPFDHVRSWTVRFLGDERKLPSSLLAPVVQLAHNDPSLAVRSQLACTAKRLPADQTLAIVAGLIQHDQDAKDPQMPLLLWWAVEDKSVTARAQVLKFIADQSSKPLALLREAIVPRLARRYLAERTTLGDESCAKVLASPNLDLNLVVAALNAGLAGQPRKEVPPSLRPWLDRLLAGPKLNGEQLSLAMRLGDHAATARAIRMVANRQTPISYRLAILAAIADTRPADTAHDLLKILATNPTQAEQVAIFAALERYADDRIAPAVLELYNQLPESSRSRAISLLCIRKGWASQLLAAIDRGDLPRGALSLEQVRELQQFKDPTIAKLLLKQWGQLRASTNEQVRARVAALTHTIDSAAGNPTAGKLLFNASCAKCHRLYDGGNRIGPDLVTAERKRLDVLLPNIIDPSAMIRPEFQSYKVVTDDGRILIGLMAESSPETVTLLHADNTHTVISRDSIEQLEPSSISLMPEKLLDALSEQQVRDLVAYLRSEPVTAAEKAMAKASLRKKQISAPTQPAKGL